MRLDDVQSLETGSINEMPFIIGALLLTGLIIALSMAAAAQSTVPCSTCRMDLEDSCQPFASNDSEAYEEAMARVLGIIPESPYASNFSNLSWSRAFLEANRKMKAQYAFTGWRGIDWDGLYQEFAPDIEEAEKTGDKARYYRTLRKYVVSYPTAM